MKAIFAVSALAAAISAQAIAADTEATTTFSGAMDAQFTYDLAADPAQYDVNLNDDDDFLYGLSMEVEVVNGPFSGSIGIESDENDSLGVTVGDLVVTDGKLSFGQVGNLMETDEYVDGTVAMDDAEALSDDIGFRYMVAEGATVQLGGTQEETQSVMTNSIFLAAQYMGEAGALSYVVEGEVQASATGADNDLDPPMFVGAGVTYTADVATVTAALNYSGDSAGDTYMEYAVDVQSTIAGLTVGAGYYEANSEVDDNEEAAVEVSYAIDAITVSAGYTFTTAESAGDEVTAGVAWAQDALSASADVTIENFDADTADSPMIELNVTYTSEAGVDYYADYELQAEEADALTPVAETNKLTLGAKYSF